MGARRLDFGYLFLSIHASSTHTLSPEALHILGEKQKIPHLKYKKLRTENNMGQDTGLKLDHVTMLGIQYWYTRILTPPPPLPQPPPLAWLCAYQAVEPPGHPSMHAKF